MSGRVPPPYTPEVRAEAIRLVREGGRSPAEAAAVVGCSDQTVRNWLAQADRDAGWRSDGLTTEERTEQAQLRRRSRCSSRRRRSRKKPRPGSLRRAARPHRKPSSSSRRTGLPIRLR